MKPAGKLWFLLGLAMIGTASLLLWILVQAFSSPGICVDQPSFDAGLVPISDKMDIKHDFIIRNIGRKKLRLLDIQSSCGCTTIKADREIASRSEGRLRVVLHLNNSIWGRKTATIKAVTNDPENPIVNFSMSGSVEFGISVSPLQINLGNILKGEKKIDAFRLLCSPKQVPEGLRLLSVSNSAPYEIVVRLDSISPQSLTSDQGEKLHGQAADFKVMVHSGLKPGSRKEWIYLSTNCKDYKVLTVPVLWENLAPIRFAPGQIFFGIVKPSESSTKTIYLVSERADIQIAKALIETNGREDKVFGVQGVRQLDSKKSAVDLILYPTKTSGKVTSVLRVQTKDGQEYKTDISVFVAS